MTAFVLGITSVVEKPFMVVVIVVREGSEVVVLEDVAGAVVVVVSVGCVGKVCIGGISLVVVLLVDVVGSDVSVNVDVGGGGGGGADWLVAGVKGGSCTTVSRVVVEVVKVGGGGGGGTDCVVVKVGGGGAPVD